jgi:hypothetical protein
MQVTTELDGESGLCWRETCSIRTLPIGSRSRMSVRPWLRQPTIAGFGWNGPAGWPEAPTGLLSGHFGAGLDPARRCMWPSRWRRAKRQLVFLLGEGTDLARSRLVRRFGDVEAARNSRGGGS